MEGKNDPRSITLRVSADGQYCPAHAPTAFSGVRTLRRPALCYRHHFARLFIRRTGDVSPGGHGSGDGHRLHTGSGTGVTVDDAILLREHGAEPHAPDHRLVRLHGHRRKRSAGRAASERTTSTGTDHALVCSLTCRAADLVCTVALVCIDRHMHDAAHA